MAYPSLLYLNPPTKKPIDHAVFEDLQLLHFIPSTLIDTIAVPCEKEDLLARQGLLSFLSEHEEARAQLAELCLLAEELTVLDRVYTSARCESEKLFVFAALADALRRFTEKASKMNFGDALSARFSEAFLREKRENSHRAMYRALEGLMPEVDALRRQVLYTHGIDNALCKDEGRRSFLARIEDCAERLGVDLPRVRTAELHTLSPDILTAVAKLHPTAFRHLKDFHASFASLYDPAVTVYENQLHFYLAILAMIDRVKAAGLPLVYPQPQATRGIHITEAYDISLLAKEETHIVPNDISFSDEEPFFFLTGANGGGKTTYLRTVGIALMLYLNGCPVPCRKAEIGEIDGVFTHFPRDERFDGSGRFVEEHRRVEEILNEIGENSLVLLNETYATTNEENAVAMTERLASELHQRRVYGLYITHQHALSDNGVPYLNVVVDRTDANRRTYKIERQKSRDGSFAADILRKCRLTPADLRERFGLREKEAEDR